MRWLISNEEPEALCAPVLTEKHLRAGAVREFVKVLPWYKKTPQMEVLLAQALTGILLSGFERSFIVRQMRDLDIAEEDCESFLRSMEERGACRFAEPRYAFNPVVHSTPHDKGWVVKHRYLPGKRLVSKTLFQCLQLLDGLEPHDSYMRALADFLGNEEYPAKVYEALAQQGLLMSCDGPRAPVTDYGPRAWTLDMVGGAGLLSAEEWSRRVDFLTDHAGLFFFQSRRDTTRSFVRLRGDFATVTGHATPDYMRDVYFRLCSFSEVIPLTLTASAPFSRSLGAWAGLRLELAQVFRWGLTLDLRRDGDAVAEDLLKFVEGGGAAGPLDLTLLLGESTPAALSRLRDAGVYARVYLAGPPGAARRAQAAEVFPAAIQRALMPAARAEGCGATLSPYIDGGGDLYACSLEGAARLGHIDDGVEAVERRRRELREASSGACGFGADPIGPGEGDANERLAGSLPDLDLGEAWNLDCTCP